MEKIYGLPNSMAQIGTHTYCPGCMHGTAMGLMLHAIDKYDVLSRCVIVNPVGCGGLGLYVARPNYVGAAHGRAAAVATGIKRCCKDAFVISYQGDGDLAAIGIAETIHAANRGENITVIFANNTTYGMTGGQMAPTTLIGQYSTTTPKGRNAARHGNPIKMAEIIAGLDAPAFVARYSLHDAKHVLQAKKGIEKAFEVNLNGGYAFVELLTNCPTNWKMTPEQTTKKIAEENIKAFPLGVYKEVK